MKRLKTLKEYIEYYEEELDELEEKKMGLLEADKSIAYTDSKIDFIYNLLTILRNCENSETLKEQNIDYKHLKYTITVHLERIEKAKEEDEQEEIKEMRKLTEFLKKEMSSSEE